MNRRRKALIVLICLAAFVTLLRETGLADFSWHNSTINSNTTSSWTDYGFNIESTDTILKEIPEGNCYSNIREVPMEVYLDDIHLGDTTSCNHIMVFVHDVRYGFVYSPLYKKCDFRCTVTCNSTVSFYDEQDSTMAMTSKSINGTLTVTGNFTSFGFISARKARHDIREHIAQQVYQIVKQHVETAN